MNLTEFYQEAYSLTEAELYESAKEIERAYKELRKDLDKAIKDQYTKYLSAVNTDDYYNEMIKYDRLRNLELQIKQDFTKTYKKINKRTEEALRKGFSNLYYRHAYIAGWLDPQPGYLIGALPKDLINLSILGTKDAWKKITESIIKTFGDKINYQPKIGTLAKLLNDNSKRTLDKILRQITNGLTSGYSYNKMSKSLYDIIGRKLVEKGQISYSGAMYNSMRIVRTEGTRVMNNGAYAQTKYMESLDINVYKMWIASLDDLTRDSHAGLDGKKVKPEELFHIGSDAAKYPGEFSLVKNNVNCRCTTGQIIGDDSPELRRGKNPVTGEYEVLDYKPFNQWAADNNLVKNKYGEMYIK